MKARAWKHLHGSICMACVMRLGLHAQAELHVLSAAACTFLGGALGGRRARQGLGGAWRRDEGPAQCARSNPKP